MMTLARRMRESCNCYGGAGKDEATAAEVGDVEFGEGIDVSESNDDVYESGGKRGKWSSPAEFLLTCIGYSVGLGNVWRFPYLCYKNGGGAFLIAYIVMIILIGIPLLLLEFSFGQYFGIGSLSIFKKVCPIFQGVGIGYIVLNALVAIYYNVIIAKALYYIFGSFTSELPWASCGHDWNTDDCRDTSRRYSNVTEAVTSSLNESLTLLLGNNSVTSNATTRKTSPTDEYFRLALMNEEPGINIENLGDVRWHLCLCLVLAWILVILFVSRGIQSTGKVAYFTATFPYVMLTVLVVRGVTLPGAVQGITYFFYPNWKQLASPEVWFQAATQLFYSTNLAWGGMITMSSYNSLHHNCYRDTLIINMISFFTSIYAGVAVFAIIGYMAIQYEVPVNCVINSGPGLAFVAYPQALSLMPLSQLWTVLFFFMLFLLGIGSQMVLIETVVTGFVDEFPKLGLNKCIRFLTTFSVCVVFFISGISMTTQGGMYVLQLMDHYSAGFGVLVIAIVECVAVSWIYGATKMADHIQFMTGHYPNRWLQFCWKYISPLLIVAILVFSFIKYHPVEYGNEQYPIWADLIGWMMPLSTNLPIVIVAVIVVYRSQGNTILERVRAACRHRLYSHRTPVVTDLNVNLSGSKQSIHNGDIAVPSDDKEYRMSIRL